MGFFGKGTAALPRVVPLKHHRVSPVLLHGLNHSSRTAPSPKNHVRSPPCFPPMHSGGSVVSERPISGPCRAPEEPRPRARTEADEAEGFPADSRGSRGHLPDLLHALHARALAQGLVEPRVPPVQVQHMAHGGIRRLLHGRRGDVTHGDPCGGHTHITALAPA